MKHNLIDFVSLTLFVLLPQFAFAQLTAILQQDIGRQALYDLQHVDSQKRIVAMQTFLDHPKLLSQWLRLSLGKVEHQSSHLKLLWLLGMTGNANDIPKLLKFKPARENSYELRTWKGAIQRLAQNQRGFDQFGVTIQKMALIPYSKGEKQNSYKGQLTYQLKNKLPEGRLIQVQIRVWYAKLENNIPVNFFWIPKQKTMKQSMTLHIALKPIQQDKTQQPVNPIHKFRIDLKVGEVGHLKNIAHQKIWETVQL